MERQGKPVLVVEDHDDTRVMVETILQIDGYPVMSARHGLQALEFIQRTKPCLILLDVMMPVMDGLAFGRRLRAHADPHLAEIPIVLMTAVPSAAAIQDEIGAIDVIGKPISIDVVLETVERHCPLF